MAKGMPTPTTTRVGYDCCDDDSRESYRLPRSETQGDLRGTSCSSRGARSRSLSPVRTMRPIRQVFGRLLEAHACHECESSTVAEDSVDLSERSNDQSTSALVDDEAATRADLLHEVYAQRTTRVTRTVSHNLSRVSPSTSSPALHPRPRVKIQYRDEAIRTGFCRNAQHLIDLVQNDPNTETTSAFIAKKALQYRRVGMDRIGKIDLRDPTFDVSRFFGIEWCKA